MKILVTGREGQLARSLVERAGGVAGIELVTLGRPELDLERPDDLAAAILRVMPDAIINAAAYTAVDKAEQEPERAQRVNGDAPGRLAAAAAQIGARFVQISTDYVYDGSGDTPYREDSATGPLGVYGRTKLAGEDAARAACPDTVVVRTSWVYSPFGANFVRTMMTLADSRDTLSVVDDQVGNPSSALDLADGLLAMVSRWTAAPRTGLGRTYHLAGSGHTSWAGLAGEVMLNRRARGLPAAVVTPIGTADWPTPATRPKNSRLDTTAFQRDFGYVAPRWQDSTADVVRRLAT